MPSAGGSEEPTVTEGDDRISSATHDARIEESIRRVEARIRELEQENEKLRGTPDEREEVATK